jgi:hypothetical protein
MKNISKIVYHTEYVSKLHELIASMSKEIIKLNERLKEKEKVIRDFAAANDHRNQDNDFMWCKPSH